MYIRCSFFFVVLTISWLARASCRSNASNNLLLDQLTKSCPSDGIPVCGIRDKQLVLFSNGCLLNEANKDILQSDKIVSEVPLQYCMTGCQFSCPTTYEPVCGRNIKTSQMQLFKNQCELMKYACKMNMDYLKINLYECPTKTYSKNNNKLVEKRSHASEQKERPISCINIFKPVCGTYMGVKSSFQNECLLNAENVAFNKDWRVVNHGICPEDYSKDRRRKDNQSMRHLIKKRSYHNSLYNQIEYSPNEFVDNKNKLNIVPNDVYVYMPPEIRTQYLNHDAPNYQQTIPQHKTYDEILNKIASFSPAGMSFSVEEDKRDIDSSISETSNITPPPFAINGIDLSYLSDQNLANGFKEQKVPSVEPFTGDDKKQYYYAFAKIDPSIGSEIIPVSTTSRNTSNEKHLDEKAELMGKNIECKFGSDAICAALADGTLRTFETICEMMTANVYFKSTWTKLHDGACENCRNNCSRDYQPICVSRNGVNYTMVNECYYNMAICMDKISKWQKISNNECESYTRIPDKYANSKPGFHYTSNYFVSETTAMPSTNSLPLSTTTTPKSLNVKSNKSKERRPNFKRAISSHACCPEPNDNDKFSKRNKKCECSSEMTQTSPTTETHIMSLVKERR